MIKYIIGFIAAFITSISMAGPLDVTLQQRNATDNGNITRTLTCPTTGTDCIISYNLATSLPTYITLGSGLTITSGVLGISVPQADWNATSGPTQILNKPSIATVGFTGDYMDLTNRPTIPTPITIQRVRVQTASDGTYTWTFPTAFGTGVTPVVEISSEGSSSINFQHTITAISNTSVTVKVTPVQDVTLLGIHILGIQSSQATYIHLTAIAP